MATTEQIRKALITEIEDLEMAATMRGCPKVVSKKMALAKRQMSSDNEPAALKALCDGVWALAVADPWQGKKKKGKRS